MVSSEEIFSDLALLRESSPLIHNITNFVVMNNTANALLAIGASPVMAHAYEEVTEITSISSALVINIGTLSSSWVKSMQLSMKRAEELGKPVIFDPVGAGASTYRNNTIKSLLSDTPPNIIRGNASEIFSLYSEKFNTKGVDSTVESSTAIDAAKYLSKTFNCITIISGQNDYITGKESITRIENGSPLMARVTGMGCTATAITGAFAAIQKNLYKASISAMVVMGISGELAAAKAAGPGSFQMYFLDALYNLKESDINNHIRIGNEKH